MALPTLELTFPRASPPYAEVAAYIHAVRPYNAKSLQLIVTANKDAKMTLSVPAVSPKTRPTIVSASGVLRYVARLAPDSRALYDESSLAEAALSDTLFDRARTASNSHEITRLAQYVDEHRQKYLVVDDKPMLGDFAVWGSLRAYKKIFNQIPGTKDLRSFNAWLSNIDHLPDANLAVEMVDAAIDAFDNPVDMAAIAASANKITVIPEIGDASISDPRNNPLDVFKNLIAVQIAPMAGVEAVLIHGIIEAPRQPEHGDFSIAVPRLKPKGNPTQLAKEWAERFVPNDHVIATSSIGPFLNFRVSKQQLNTRLLRAICSQKQDFGKNKSGAGKLAIIEYSSPNIAKPFHAGHLRSTVIGQFVKNVLEANGWKTIGMNYLGDWGKQYGLLAIGFNRYGSNAELEKDAIKHLYDVYVQINRDTENDESIHDEARAYFRKMEDGDTDALALWARFRDLSIIKYRETYARLGIEFDVYSGESQVKDGMIRALAKIKELGMLKESEGAQVIELSEYKLGTVLVQKNDGAALYITRDIGAAIERYEKYKFDAMYYIVAAQQDLHVKQLFKVLDLMDYEWASRCHHINFGMVTGMSTRKGTTVFLDTILDQAQSVMHDEMRKNDVKYAQISDPDAVADEIGITAVKVQDMSARRIKNYDFDWARMVSFEGDTGPYLQYAHARLCSIERNCNLDINPDADLSLLNVPAAQQLLVMIAKYPDVVRTATQSFEPVNVTTFCFDLSHSVSLALETLWVMGQEKSIAEARLLMYWAARITLGNAMRLLGLKPLERM